MKSWIHDISESYVASHKPVRRDLKENYVSLNEEQKFSLLSENVLVYLDEQLRNAFGFGLGDLTEEQLNTIFSNLIEYKGAKEVAAKRGKEAGERRERRIRAANQMLGQLDGTITARSTMGSTFFDPKSHERQVVRAGRSYSKILNSMSPDSESGEEIASKDAELKQYGKPTTPSPFPQLRDGRPQWKTDPTSNPAPKKPRRGQVESEEPDVDPVDGYPHIGTGGKGKRKS